MSEEWIQKFKDDIDQLAANFSFNLSALFRAGTSYEVEMTQANVPEKGNGKGVGKIKVTVVFKEGKIEEADS